METEPDERQLTCVKDIQSASPIAQIKWLQGKVQELKTQLFGQKQQYEKYQQQIVDIKEGKMNNVKFSMLQKLEEIDAHQKDLDSLLHQYGGAQRSPIAEIDLTAI